MDRRRYNLFSYAFFLLLADTAAYYIALIIAYYIRHSMSFVIPLNFSLAYFLVQFWALGLVLFFNFASGLYNRRDPFWQESGRLIKALVMSLVLVLSIVTLGHFYDQVSRLFLCLFWLILPFFMLSTRYLTKRQLHKYDIFKPRTLLVGAGERADKIESNFNNEVYMGLKIVAKLPLVASLTETEIDTILQENLINTVIIVAPEKDDYGLLPVLSYIHTKVSHLYYVPSSGSLDLTNSETGQLLSSQTGYMLINNALKSKFNRIIKRIFDLLLAILIFPAVISLILFLILLIKKGSPGPGLFRHERIGRDGKAFKVYKLRTMYQDADKRLAEMLKDPEVKAEWEQFYKLKNDPRITKLGSFLRKSSLDELPQFFNVLRGEMSFVGPRPVLKDEIDKYYGRKAVYYNMATPGITGLWQINGRNDLSYGERVDMDAWYVFNWSLWLDIVILISTPVVVLVRKGAY